MKFKFAFTLSEVLIALVVIGVIATITIPTVTANYRRIDATAKLKKAYSMLKNAETRAKADGILWEDWALETDITTDVSDGGKRNVEFAEKYLLPYLNRNKTEVQNYHLMIRLDDGTKLDVKKGNCIDFMVDINGDKKPNVAGRDIFTFLYCPMTQGSGFIKEGQVIPYLFKRTKTREQAKQDCIKDGWVCTGLLSFDSFEFKEDYPHKI